MRRKSRTRMKNKYNNFYLKIKFLKPQKQQPSKGAMIENVKFNFQYCLLNFKGKELKSS